MDFVDIVAEDVEIVVVSVDFSVEVGGVVDDVGGAAVSGVDTGGVVVDSSDIVVDDSSSVVVVIVDCSLVVFFVDVFSAVDVFSLDAEIVD